MEPFEYVVVLTSIILGLGIAQILMGFSDIVAHWEQTRFCAPHAIYALVVFLIHIQDWWFSYQYSFDVQEWTLQLVLGILLFPIILFLQARLLFPTGTRRNETDMVKYFDDQWRLLYILGMITVLISIWQNQNFSDIPMQEQIPLLVYILVYMVFIIGNIRNHIAHTIFASLQLIAFIVYIITDDIVLV